MFALGEIRHDDTDNSLVLLKANNKLVTIVLYSTSFSAAFQHLIRSSILQLNNETFLSFNLC